MTTLFDQYQNFESLKNKSVLITGVTSGIGAAICQMLLELGVKVKGVSRREDRLKAVQNQFENFDYIVGDINSDQTLASLESKGFFDVDVLINNAGLALGKDQFENSNDRDNDLVLTTNVNSAFKIARRCLKSMREKSYGDIINICSIASHDAYAGGVVYCASKHALLAMGKALRFETHGDNIRIINISPGMVETEFSIVRFKGDQEKADSVYKGMKSLKPIDIAYQVTQAIMTPRHVNLDEIIILSADQAGATTAKRQ